MPDDSWRLEVHATAAPTHGGDRRTKEYSMVAIPENARKKTITLGTIWRTDNDPEQAMLDLFRMLAGVNWSSSKKAGG